MYCRTCGRYNIGEVDKCKYCGSMNLTKTSPYGQTGSYRANNSYRDNGVHYANDRKTVGILMSIFLGLIGLIIGLLIYVDGYERSTFISGWLKGLWISIGIALVIVGIVSCSTCSLLGKYY